MALNFHGNFDAGCYARAFLKNFIFPGQQCAFVGMTAGTTAQGFPVVFKRKRLVPLTFGEIPNVSLAIELGHKPCIGIGVIEGLINKLPVQVGMFVIALIQIVVVYSERSGMCELMRQRFAKLLS